MEKINLYFKSSEKVDVQVEKSGSQVHVHCSGALDYYSKKEAHSFVLTLEEASYLASALRMVLGQQKVAQRK